MSGISHLLLLGFSISFILEGWEDAHSKCDDDEDEVNGWIVLYFALGGLVFDAITLLSYRIYGTVNADVAALENEDNFKKNDIAYEEHSAPNGLRTHGQHDELTCGINTNMCAAILHVLSDLMRSTTTLIEAIVILSVSGICSVEADGISTLAVCTIIVVGALGATLTWIREVYLYCVSPVGVPTDDDLFNDLANNDGFSPPTSPMPHNPILRKGDEGNNFGHEHGGTFA